MMMCNNYGKACKIWGGYSSKIYDEHFIKMITKQLKKAIGGTNIIANQHFNYKVKGRFGAFYKLFFSVTNPWGKRAK